MLRLLLSSSARIVLEASAMRSVGYLKFETRLFLMAVCGFHQTCRAENSIFHAPLNFLRFSREMFLEEGVSIRFYRETFDRVKVTQRWLVVRRVSYARRRPTPGVERSSCREERAALNDRPVFERNLSLFISSDWNNRKQ